MKGETLKTARKDSECDLDDEGTWTGSCLGRRGRISDRLREAESHCKLSWSELPEGMTEGV